MKIRNVIILLILISVLCTLTAEEIPLSSLMLEGLSDMPLALLSEKSRYLSLDETGTREEVLDRLFAYYGYTQVSPRVGEDTGSGISLVHAYYYYMDSEKQNTILSGEVELAGENWTISADILFYDPVDQIIAAVGNVHFTQGDFTVTSHALVYTIADGDLTIYDGATDIEKSSADGEPLLLHTEGEAITVDTNLGVYGARDGSITSSKEHSYYSIDASDALFIAGNDMFISDATLKMGRVPVLYLPFFFYPGKTLSFNPLFGYDSEKGSFFTTAFEVYGRNPLSTSATDEEGSFTTFFSDERELLRQSGSLTYEAVSKESYTPLETWAQESGSYLSLYADSFTEKGIHLGFDSFNTYRKDMLSADIAGGVAFPGVSPAAAMYPSARFYIEPDITMKFPAFQAHIKFPVYSDTDVKKDYYIQERFGNFYNSFFADETALTSGSSISSYRWSADAAFSWEPEFLGSVVEHISISSLESTIDFVRSYDTSTTGFIIDDITPFSFSGEISGKLFSFRKSGPEKISADLSSYDEYARSMLEEFLIEPLSPLSRETDDQSLVFSSDLSYQVKQKSDYTQDYQKGIEASSALRHANSSSLVLATSLLPGFLKVTQTLSSEYSDTEENDEKSNRYTLSYTHALSIPMLFLTHTYKQRLYRYEGYTAADGALTEESASADFTRESVLAHTLSVSPVLNFSEIAVTPSLSLVLPPLEGVLTLALKGERKPVSLKSSFRFEEDAGGYALSAASLTADYTGKVLSTDHTLTTNPSGTDFISDISLDSRLILDITEPDISLVLKGRYLQDLLSYESASARLESRHLKGSLNLLHTGDELEFSTGEVQIQTGSLSHSWWKDRLEVATSLTGTYAHSFFDPAGSYLLFSLDFTFDIYQFLTFEFSVKSQNKGLYRYADWSDLLNDLADSFDFFSGGIYRTQFVMDSISMKITHRMDDWDLVLAYNGKMALENNRYTWSPSFSIFMKWKAIPEINIDRKLEL